MRLEGGFERGGRIRVAECLRQIVPDRWASIRKKVFYQMFLCLHGRWQRFVLTRDSDLKNVARRRIDSTGNTSVRTFRGATVAQLINIISTGACYPQVEQVAVTTGTNGCAGNTPWDIADYQKLLSAIKVNFPTAEVAAAATAPQAKWRCNVRHDRRTQQR